MLKNFRQVGFNLKTIPTADKLWHSQHPEAGQEWARGWNDCLQFLNTLAESQKHLNPWPSTPEELRYFIGSDFSSMSYGHPDHEEQMTKWKYVSPPAHENDSYLCSAHDLISSFSNWQVWIMGEIPDGYKSQDGEVSEDELRLHDCVVAAEKVRLERDKLAIKVQMLESLLKKQTP